MVVKRRVGAHQNPSASLFHLRHLLYRCGWASARAETSAISFRVWTTSGRIGKESHPIHGLRRLREYDTSVSSILFPNLHFRLLVVSPTGSVSGCPQRSGVAAMLRDGRVVLALPTHIALQCKARSQRLCCVAIVRSAQVLAIDLNPLKRTLWRQLPKKRRC